MQAAAAAVSSQQRSRDGLAVPLVASGLLQGALGQVNVAVIAGGAGVHHLGLQIWMPKQWLG